MATDPLTAPGSHPPSVYADPGIGADPALDAFAGDVAQPPPVDPAQLLAHDVSCVVVAHNGARWLPRTLQALAEQRRPPDRIIAVDTGSTDDTAGILTATLGAPAVVSAPRTTGFGAAVAHGVATADETARVGYGFGRAQRFDPPADRRTRWIWMLHDDSAPAPDALARLLERAVRRPDAGIIGPKVLDWRGSRQLLEVGLTITGGGRRHTGLDRREYDQGQHDDPKDVLAVGSAGMLVRRDVWDALGGFDARLPLFRDDIDLGWRANQAGYAVVVSPDAVVHHAEAAAHGRRRLAAIRDRAHLADRRNALYVMLANAPAAVWPLVLLRLIVTGLGRSIGFLLGKQPALAAEELVALVSVIGRPDALIRARTRRRRTRVRPSGQLRPLFPPGGQPLRSVGENVLGMISGSGPAGHDVTEGRRAATDSGDESEVPAGDDAFVLRVLFHPAVLLVTGLVVVTLAAGRTLIGSGRLLGGALLPAPAAAADLWQVYTESWHGGGLGSPAATPPYVAVVAVLGAVLRNASLAVDVLLLGSVPLAALTMYVLASRLVETKLLRVWVAATYALLPATTGAIAAGRLGTAGAAVLTPLLVLAVMRTMGAPGRPGPGRAAWSAGLLLALIAAFVPLAWVIALVLGAVGALTVFRDRRSLLRIGVTLAVTPVVLVPWTGGVLRDPILLLVEAGRPGPGLSDPELAPWSVLLFNPGGPGTGPLWLGAGVVLAGWAALLRPDRRLRIGVACAVAGVGLVAGVVLSRLPVTGPTLETPVAGWPGYPAVLVGGAVLVAAALGAEGARERLSRASFGWRQPVAVVIALAAALAPIAGAVWWVARGAADPVERRDPRILPAYVADEAQRPERVRTLVLTRADDGRVTYALLRESGPRLGDAETTPYPDEYAALGQVVADIVSGRGGADGARLAEFAAKFVYLPRPADADLADMFDALPGLVRTSAPEGAAMWQVDQPVARVWVAEPDVTAENVAASQDAELVTIPSGPVDAAGPVPPGAPGRTLVLSELADPGWSATADGTALTPTTYGGWAQAFELPAEGGQVEVFYAGNRRSVWLWTQLVAVVVAVVLALPGMRRQRGAVDDAAELDPDDSTPELPVVGPDPNVPEPAAVGAVTAAAAGPEPEPATGTAPSYRGRRAARVQTSEQRREPYRGRRAAGRRARRGRGRPKEQP